MAHMDIFRSQAAGAFSMAQLTALLIDQPHVPMRLGKMGLFEVDGIRTTEVTIERQGNTLVLVNSSPRGGPRQQNTKDARSVVRFQSARLALTDTIMAEEVQGIRALGSENELMAVVDEVMRRMRKMSDSIEATIEFHRIGALKGIVADPNGSVIVNLYTELGVSQQTEQAFDLQAASPASGILRKNCSKVIRLIRDELGFLPYDHIHCICSSQFFDDLTAHPEYREFQKGYSAAQGLAQGLVEGITSFGGIIFEEYRGQVGGVSYVDDDKAIFFPVGVPGLFIHRNSPAEYEDTVNTIGLPRYADIFPDPEDPRSKVKANVQAHLTVICTRPRTLIPAKRGA